MVANKKNNFPRGSKKRINEGGRRLEKNEGEISVGHIFFKTGGGGGGIFFVANTIVLIGK